MDALRGTGIWSGALRFSDPAVIADAAAELEELGYSCLWIPDMGGDVFGAVGHLLDSTRTLTVATGVLNLWMHSPEMTAAAHARLQADYGDRFLLGIGVGHAARIDAVMPGRYKGPVGAMNHFLDALDNAPVPLPRNGRVLAALGPKMLETAAGRAAGVHPYNVTPDHSAQARAVLGPDALVLPEQAVVLTTDPEVGRWVGRTYLQGYLTLPNYVNNMRRMGFGDDDFTGGGSDRLVDALVVWGDEEAIKARLDEHRAAGANHICIQV
ncbi:MAG TPA: LLM class F420-dependent oxidoreductase, partial [Acidimicrobiales bacterium]|nr:LLM class F420-dependent oxidoreductase [Acidimicrobiales bacterium]